MTKIVRTLGIGRCSLLGELVDETETRYFYRRRSGNVLAFVETGARSSRRGLQGVPGLLIASKKRRLASL
jgi:hypothetical protein